MKKYWPRWNHERYPKTQKKNKGMPEAFQHLSDMIITNAKKELKSLELAITAKKKGIAIIQSNLKKKIDILPSVRHNECTLSGGFQEAVCVQPSESAVSGINRTFTGNSKGF